MEKVEKVKRELSGFGKDSANREQNIELARILCRGAAYLMQGRLNDSFSTRAYTYFYEKNPSFVIFGI